MVEVVMLSEPRLMSVTDSPAAPVSLMVLSKSCHSYRASVG